MTSSLPQGMDFWQLCKIIGDAVAVYALFVLTLAAIRAGWALLKRLTCLSVRAAGIAGDALGVAAAWPFEVALDQSEKWVAFGTEWRAQRKIWRAEFRKVMPWDAFRRQVTGQTKPKRDDYTDALSLFGLVEPFTRQDMDARFKRIMQGVHPDAGGCDYLAQQVTAARTFIQAKRMEKMSHKSELTIIREQQVARLRESTGTPERFVADFACARHDRAFRATFARFSAAQRFRCESVDKAEPHQATTIARLQGLLRPAEALRIRTEDVDVSTVSCAWCAAASGWTLCASCKTLICGARRSGHSFTCRDSCGAQFQTAPLEALDAGPVRVVRTARDRAWPKTAAGERPVNERKLEMDNTATLNIGRLSIEISADCPDRSVFENVVRDQPEWTFGGDAGRAAFAKSEFDRCMDVPEPFIRNFEAASHYQCAQLAMSPAGQQWQMFKDSLQAHLLDRHPDDGTAQEPAIPGGNRRGKSTLQCARPPGRRKPNATPGRNGSVEEAAPRPCANGERG